ncbi:MAG: lysoplasmalogenase [Acidobacteria bacterium]|nr:lysoplasmalogenase [Acidobacteriota bacterium]
MSAVLALLLRREFNLIDKLLLALSVSSALVYLLTLDRQPFSGSVVIKALGMATLALLVLRVLKTLDGLLLSAALLFSCIGDVMLAVRGANLFLYGLLAFLLAHIFYIWLFARNLQRPLRLHSEQKIVLLGILLFSAAMTWWLWDGFGALKLLALIYLCAITLMCVMATLMNLPKRAVVIGALLFLLSDSLIAANKFKTTIPLSHYAIWISYYVGQGLLALGFLREKLRA